MQRLDRCQDEISVKLLLRDDNNTMYTLVAYMEPILDILRLASYAADYSLPNLVKCPDCDIITAFLSAPDDMTFQYNRAHDTITRVIASEHPHVAESAD